MAPPRGVPRGPRKPRDASALKLYESARMGMSEGRKLLTLANYGEASAMISLFKAMQADIREAIGIVTFMVQKFEESAALRGELLRLQDKKGKQTQAVTD